MPQGLSYRYGRATQIDSYLICRKSTHLCLGNNDICWPLRCRNFWQLRSSRHGQLPHAQKPQPPSPKYVDVFRYDLLQLCEPTVYSFGRKSTTRRALPCERSTLPGSPTRILTEMPTVSFIFIARAWLEASLSSAKELSG